MGTFVQGLTGALRSFDFKLTTANQQKEEALSAMENMLVDLEALKKQDADANKKLATLQQEVVKLKKLTSSNDIFGDSPRNALDSFVGLDSKGLIALFARSPTMAESHKLASTPSATDAIALAGTLSATDALNKALEDSGSGDALGRILKDKK
jgi:hypothetical protein